MEMIDYDPKKKYVEKGELTKYWRVIWDNKEFADELFKRLKDGNYLPGDGKKYKCCNSVFRIAKYDSWGQFQIHRDGQNKNECGEKTHLTLNIFLNKDFKGGETDFFLDDKKTFRCSVKSAIGKAALFYHKQYHCGNIVSEGEKYLLRTDVMI